MDLAVDLERGQSECDGRLVGGAADVSMPEQVSLAFLDSAVYANVLRPNSEWNEID
jgi:hypothetical protein